MNGAILALARAMFWGSVAGGGPFMLLTVPIAIFESDWSEPGLTIWMVVMPVVFAAVAVAAATVLFGLPLTALLAHLKQENHSIYVWAGLGLGALLPLSITLFLDGGASGAFFAPSGALAGAVTAAIWGRWREEVSARVRQAEGEKDD